MTSKLRHANHLLPAGDIEAEAQVEYLMVYHGDGSANFVRIAQVVGEIGGKIGTFVLQRSGIFNVVRRLLGKLALLALYVSCSSEAPHRPPETAASSQDIAESDSLPRPPVNQTPDARELHASPGLLTPDGWGPLRIGMSRAEVVAAAGEDARPDAVGGPDPETCDEFRPREAPVGVLVMIQENVLTRISVNRTSDISTPAGFRVGDSGTAVLTEYGSQALVEPHQYWEAPAKYVTVWRDSDDERRGIRYEINTDDEVVHIRAGGPSIAYVEGCV